MTQVLDVPRNIVTLDTMKTKAYDELPVAFETKDGHRGRLVTNPITNEFAVLSAVFNDSATFKGFVGDSRIGIIEKALTAGIKVYVFDELQIAARDHNAWIFMSRDTRLMGDGKPCQCDACKMKREKEESVAKGIAGAV